MEVDEDGILPINIQFHHELAAEGSTRFHENIKTAEWEAFKRKINQRRRSLPTYRGSDEANRGLQKN